MFTFVKDKQYYKFCIYGFLKNLRFFDAFFILFLIEKGLPFTQIGILYALREITINVFEIPSGMLADTFGRKRALIVSFLVYIISFVCFYISTHFGIFVIAFILYGIGDAFRSGTHKGMIMDYLKQHQWSEQKIAYYGHTRAWSQRGSAISSLIAAVIIFFRGNYDSIFLFSTIPYILNLLLILSYPNELNRARPLDRGKRQALRETFSSFFIAIKNIEVIKLINTSALHSAYMRAVKDYIQPVMLSVALLIPLVWNISRDQQNGLTIGIFYFFIFVTTAWASQTSAHFIRKRGVSITTLTLILGFISGIICGFFFHQEWWILALVAFVMIYIIENVRKPILTGFVADKVPGELLTSVLSAQSLIKTILTAGIAFLTGLFADIFGIGWSLFIVSGLLLLGTLILYLLSLRKTAH